MNVREILRAQIRRRQEAAANQAAPEPEENQEAQPEPEDHGDPQEERGARDMIPQAGPIRLRRGQGRGPYRNIKPYNMLSASRKSRRKASLKKSVLSLQRSLPRDVKTVKVEITLDCGKQFEFSLPEIDEDMGLALETSADLNMKTLAIKDRFCVSDKAMHMLHMLGKPLPALSQLIEERKRLNEVLPIQTTKEVSRNLYNFLAHEF